MKRRTVTVGAVALMAFTTASAGDDKTSEAAAGKLAKFERTGETQSCLRLRRIDHIKPLDERHFLVEAGTEYYLNTTNSKCSGADGINHRLQYRTTQAQLCRLEIVSVVDNSSGVTVGSCALGDFERLTEKKDTASG